MDLDNNCSIPIKAISLEAYGQGLRGFDGILLGAEVSCEYPKMTGHVTFSGPLN